MIFKSIEHAAQNCRWHQEANGIVVVTSGGFDPLHIGHLRCLQRSAAAVEKDCSGERNIYFLVIVNGDGFLTRKKGKPFMKLEERMEIVHGIRGVDGVVSYDDGSQNVIGALESLKPNYFTKGGDRDSAQNVPEAEICDKIGCYILYGVGGGKIQSSSNLIKNSL